MRFYSNLFLLFLLALIASTHAAAAPPGYSSRNIKFASNGDTLAGTILKPEHPFAALVIVHGSGQEKRMMEFAALLAEKGIAVLTYDKRGVGESGGVYAGPEVGTNNVDSANLHLLSLDASAAVNVLSADLSADHIPLGLIGGSQAGWIIPLAAKKNSNVNFMVIFSGALVTVREQLRFQFYTRGNADFWDTHTEEGARKHIFNDADRYQFIDTDPSDVLSKLFIPGLWIYGGRDIQVPVKLSIEHLNNLKFKNKRYEYRLFPDLGHNTAFSKSKEPIETAVQWIKEINQHALSQNSVSIKQTKAGFTNGLPKDSAEWESYLRRNVDTMVPIRNRAPKGSYTVVIKFIISKDGYISDVAPATNYGYGMEAAVLQVVKKTPNWKPAGQKENKSVFEYHTVSFTFVVRKRKLFARRKPN